MGKKMTIEPLKRAHPPINYNFKVDPWPGFIYQIKPEVGGLIQILRASIPMLMLVLEQYWHDMINSLFL